MAGESISQGGRIIGRSFKLMYEYLGMTMVISAFWFILALIPTGATFLTMAALPGPPSFLIFAVVCIFLFGPVTAATYSMTHSMVQREGVGVLDFFRRLRQFYFRSVKLTIAMGAILGILLVDLRFFLGSGVTWMEYLSILWLYLILFWLLMAQYVFPVTVKQERKLLDTLKVAALLALDNVVVSLMLLIVGVALIFVSIWLQVPLLLFMAGTLGFLHCAGMDEILGKYGRSQGGADEAADEPDPDGGLVDGTAVQEEKVDV